MSNKAPEPIEQDRDRRSKKRFKKLWKELDEWKQREIDRDVLQGRADSGLWITLDDLDEICCNLQLSEARVRLLAGWTLDLHTGPVSFARRADGRTPQNSLRIEQDVFLTPPRVLPDHLEKPGISDHVGIDDFARAVVDERGPSGLICLAGVRGSGKSTALNRIEKVADEADPPPLLLRLDVGNTFDSRRFLVDLLSDVCRAAQRACIQPPRASPFGGFVVSSLGHVGRFCRRNLEWALYALIALAILYVIWILPHFFAEGAEIGYPTLRSRAEVRVGIVMVLSIIVVGISYLAWEAKAEDSLEGRPKLRGWWRLPLVYLLLVLGIAGSTLGAAWAHESRDPFKGGFFDFVSWFFDRYGPNTRFARLPPETSEWSLDESGKHMVDKVGGGAQGGPMTFDEAGKAKAGGVGAGPAVTRYQAFVLSSILAPLVLAVSVPLALLFLPGKHGLFLRTGVGWLTCLLFLGLLLAVPLRLALACWICHELIPGRDRSLVSFTLVEAWGWSMAWLCVGIALLPRWWATRARCWRLRRSLHAEKQQTSDVALVSQLSAMFRVLLPQINDREDLGELDTPFLQQRAKRVLEQCSNEFGRIVILVDDFDATPSKQFQEFFRLLRPMSKVSGVVCLVSVPRYFYDVYRSRELGDLHSSISDCYVLGNPRMYATESNQDSVVGRLCAEEKEFKGELKRLLTSRLKTPLADETDAVPQLVECLVENVWFRGGEVEYEGIRAHLDAVGASRRELVRETGRLVDNPEARPFEYNVHTDKALDDLRADYGVAESSLAPRKRPDRPTHDEETPRETSATSFDRRVDVHAGIEPPPSPGNRVLNPPPLDAVFRAEASSILVQAGDVEEPRTPRTPRPSRRVTIDRRYSATQRCRGRRLRIATRRARPVSRVRRRPGRRARTALRRRLRTRVVYVTSLDGSGCYHLEYGCSNAALRWTETAARRNGRKPCKRCVTES